MEIWIENNSNILDLWNKVPTIVAIILNLQKKV